MIAQTLHKPIYEKRISVLTDLIRPHLRADDRVLDIGSGFGDLGAAILASSPELDFELIGIEKHPRGNEKVETISFDGYGIPAEDRSYEVTILADVVHHEEYPMRLLKEAVRVTSRLLIIKDHLDGGLFARPRGLFHGLGGECALRSEMSLPLFFASGVARTF